MKTIKLVWYFSLMVSFLVFSSFKSAYNSEKNRESTSVQEGLVVNATYDGHEDYGYNFITKGKDGEEYTLTFQKVNDEVLKAFNLNSEAFVGSKFKITFTKEIKVTKDSDGNTDEDEVNTITNLEKL